MRVTGLSTDDKRDGDAKAARVGRRASRRAMHRRVDVERLNCPALCVQNAEIHRCGPRLIVVRRRTVEWRRGSVSDIVKNGKKCRHISAHLNDHCLLAPASLGSHPAACQSLIFCLVFFPAYGTYGTVVRPLSRLGQAARHGSSGRVRGVAVGEARVRQQQRRGRQPPPVACSRAPSPAKGPRSPCLLLLC